MKTKLLLACMIIGFAAFSQTSENKVYLFGTDSIFLKESDNGDYKKYEIIKNVDQEDVLKSFTVYNDETREFKDRFISSCKGLKEAKEIDAALNEESIMKEAEIAYFRLRSMDVKKELIAKSNYEPKAGTLIVATDVNVQQVDKRMKRQVKGIMREKMKLLRKKGNFSIEQPYKKLDNSWAYVNISKNDKSAYKFKEVLFFTADYSTEYYQNKKRIKQRLIELIADSIINKQQYELTVLKQKSDSITKKINSDNIKAQQFTETISNLDRKIKELSEEIKTIENDIENNKQQNKIIEQYKITINGKIVKLPDIEKITQEFNALDFTKTDKVFIFIGSVNNLINKYDSLIQEEHLKVRKKSIEIMSQRNIIAKSENINNEERFKLLELQSDSAFFASEINRMEKEKKILDEILIELETVLLLEISKKDLLDLNAKKSTDEESINKLKLDHKQISDTTKKELERVIINDQNVADQYKTILENQQKNLIHDEMKIDSVQIEFNDGSIENIQVIGSLKFSNQVLKFSNLGPIGFTSKTEIEDLNKRWLFANPGDDIIYSINAGKVIKDYYEKYEVDRRDYSPRNQTTTISRKYIAPLLQKSVTQKDSDTKFPMDKINDSVFVKDVFKEYSSDILTGTVFTDINGLNGNEPNGIIQTEFYKEMAIFKKRFTFNRPLYNTKGINLNVNRKSDFNFGLASYINPHFVISKIEADNKNLELSVKKYTINNQTDSVYYASTIDLRKHETFRIGLTFNVLLVDMPSAKTTICLDYSFYGGLIPVIKPESEKQPQEFTVNAIEHGATLSAEFFTDERYGLKVSAGFNTYHVYSDQFTQVGDPQEYMNNSNEWIDSSDLYTIYGRASFLAYLKPNRDGKGKIFFRYNYYMQSSSADLNWSQIQLGYAFSITKTEIPASLK